VDLEFAQVLDEQLERERKAYGYRQGPLELEECDIRSQRTVSGSNSCGAVLTVRLSIVTCALRETAPNG
jgi:hypothetical protein